MIGQRLGNYEVLARLGAGGMGEVYRAHDHSTGRDVALKVLPEAVASDPERLARFQREAKALGVLNHPNIAAIYGVEDRGARPAIVMELVAGEDLSVRIARGRVPVAEALAIARQIADAVSAAHDAGIVHRDLKPANVKVRDDGVVKVLDFGLAKASDPAAAGSATDSPTLTARATALGMILGTAAYMAPEQARGKAVDKRADIWAFGVVLFEMLAGRRAFAGDDISDVLAAVLKTEPDWGALPDVPAPVRRLIQRCLEKDPRQRLRDLAEGVRQLDDAPLTAPRAVQPF
jgi:serine/threonine protein kinase